MMPSLVRAAEIARLEEHKRRIDRVRRLDLQGARRLTKDEWAILFHRVEVKGWTVERTARKAGISEPRLYAALKARRAEFSPKARANRKPRTGDETVKTES